MFALGRQDPAGRSVDWHPEAQNASSVQLLNVTYCATAWAQAMVVRAKISRPREAVSRAITVFIFGVRKFMRLLSKERGGTLCL
jgi:hypothetical protein